MAVHERARRNFVIHVFTGLAAAAGCRHDDTTAAPPPPSSSPARAVAPADTGARANPDVRIDTSTDASITDAAAVASDAMPDGNRAPDWSAQNRPIRESDVHLPPPGTSPFGTVGAGSGGGGRMGGGGTTGDTPIGLGSIGARGNAGGASGGMGSIGFGYGTSVGGFRGRTAAMPMVRPGQATVTGSLPREVIRRVTLRNINQLRFCYEQALTQVPTLQGSIVIRYIISPQGAVATAVVDSTTLTVASVPQCFANAVRRWQFPSPEGGGIVMVIAPFTLSYPQ